MGNRHFEVVDMHTLSREQAPAEPIPDGLYNDVAPRYELEREKPVHRLIITLAQQGLTNKEIAAEVGMSDNHVSSILRQPWARERLVRVIREDVQSNIRKLFEGAVQTAATNIVAALQSPNVQLQFAASKTVIERVCGKATQPIQQVDGDLTKLTDDELERRIAAAAGN